MVKEATDSNIADLVSAREKPVLLIAYAKSCSDSHSAMAIFERLSVENPDISFVRVDASINRASHDLCKIVRYPTIILFNKGKFVVKTVAEKNQEVILKEFIDRAKEALRK